MCSSLNCEVKPHTTPLEELSRPCTPIGIIFTCYGCQLMAHTLGGQVTEAQEDSAREYGKTQTYYDTTSPLFKGLPQEGISWMSHGDYMAKVPDGFALTAHSDSCPNVAIADEARGLYGVQYHPEVNHTEHGADMIRNFLYEVCGAEGDWTMGTTAGPPLLRSGRRSAAEVLLALSGGVDSSVAAALVAEAVGNQLTCVFVDHGLMRKDEGDEVEEAFKRWDINFVRVNAEQPLPHQAGRGLSRSASGRSSARSSSGSLRRKPKKSAGWITWSKAPSIQT